MSDILHASSSSTILVTGASGFVGSALLRRLADAGQDLRAVYRDDRVQPPSGAKRVRVGDLEPMQDWRTALESVNVVVHAAARVHVMREMATDPLEEFRRTNVAGTLNLARQAAAAGVRRFVHISTIKVNGESTVAGHPFTEFEKAAPMDAYGVSKYEAEQGLQAISRHTGMELVIIRPPLVYGPGVRANFLTLLRVLSKGLPLPLAALDNHRSLVGLDNLVDFIATCIHHPAAANEIFLVSDGDDLSTTDLLLRLGNALGKPARLFAMPLPFLKFSAAIVNKSQVFQRLCCSLQVDISKASRLLGWKPPINVDEGFRNTAAAYLANENKFAKTKIEKARF